MISPANRPFIITDLPDGWFQCLDFAYKTELPTIDVDAYVSTVVDAIMLHEVADDCMKELAHGCAYEDKLFSATDEPLTQQQRDEIYAKVMNLGEILSQQLRDLKVYDEHGTLNYKLREVVGLQALVYAPRTF